MFQTTNQFFWMGWVSNSMFDYRRQSQWKPCASAAPNVHPTWMLPGTVSALQPIDHRHNCGYIVVTCCYDPLNKQFLETLRSKIKFEDPHVGSLSKSVGEYNRFRFTSILLAPTKPPCPSSKSWFYPDPTAQRQLLDSGVRLLSLSWGVVDAMDLVLFFTSQCPDFQLFSSVSSILGDSDKQSRASRFHGLWPFSKMQGSRYISVRNKLYNPPVIINQLQRQGRALKRERERERERERKSARAVNW